MNVSLNWLKERLDLGSRSIEEISDLLTFAGIEVEGIQHIGVQTDQIVVAEIKEAVQHPMRIASKSPKLTLEKANSVRSFAERRTTNASGAFTIGETKMRGVESRGMLAAGSEIGLTDKEDGLLILEGDPAPGTPVKDLFDSDTLIEVEITPNRPDLLSHSGLARELAALFKTGINPIEISEAKTTPSDSVKIDSEVCPFYSLRKISGVKVAPSPDWLASKLESIGLRPINNIVDITNYVLHELGQPLHAFDAAKVSGSIHIRNATEGETFHALDEEKYTLTATDCVISDEKGTSLALGGIMGGLDSGVTDTTTDILLESAYFTTSDIRRTSGRLHLSSDSSYRFERGVDPQGVLPASVLATQLILEIAGGNAQDSIETTGNLPSNPVDVELDHDRLNQLMDNSISTEDAEDILLRLGLKKANTTTWNIPSWRGDLERSADLVEEIARTHGLDKIPSRTGGTAVDESIFDRDYDRLMTLKEKLVAHGFYETQTIKLIAEKQLRDALPLRPLSEGDLIRVARPLSEDHAILRPSLTPGLIQSAENNLRQGAKSLRFFEAGRYFRNAGGGKAKDLEADSIALFMSGEPAPNGWANESTASLDLYDLKATLQSLTPTATLQFAARPREGFLLAGDILIDGKNIGAYAQLLPSRARELDLNAPAYLAELDLSKILPLIGSTFQVDPLPQFPGSSRDIAMELPDKTTNAEVEKAIAKHNEPLLTSATCFDHFRDPSGEKLDADKKSIAYTFTYRSDAKTLKQKDIDLAHEKLKTHLEKTLPVTFR
nr:phenylalanine--tRNA ligase beta subunit-like [Nerophis lumbriciformis]